MFQAARLVGETVAGAAADRRQAIVEDASPIFNGLLHPRRPDQRRAAAPVPDLPGRQLHRGDGRHALSSRSASTNTASRSSTASPARHELGEAAKLLLLSFDSTLRSNLSVGLPIDLLMYRKDSLENTASSGGSRRRIPISGKSRPAGHRRSATPSPTSTNTATTATHRRPGRAAPLATRPSVAAQATAGWPSRED